MRIRLHPEFAASVMRKLPPQTKRRIRDALRSLARDPLGAESGMDVKQLDREGEEARVFRVRLGEWRIVYVIEPEDVHVIRIFPRKDGYGWMERWFS